MSKTILTHALNLLTYREHSESELRQKLQQKNFCDTEIQTTLTTLTEQNLLSNTRFTASYIHARRNKGYGPLRIYAELRERGIAEDFIEHHLNMSDNVWLVEIKNVWRKRFKSQLPQDFKARAQQIRFLQHRGFTREHINSIFNSDDDS